MKAWYGLTAVCVLILVAMIGVQGLGLRMLFGVVIPYAAIGIFLFGVVAKVLSWAKSPVPFHIPTTCGQQRSLPWIRSSYIDSPHNTLGVVLRMALEVLCFRSLFANTKAALRPGPKVIFGSSKWLWAGAMLFHWCMLVVVLRHLRFFMEPVPAFVSAMTSVDGFFQIGLPELYLTTAGLLIGLLYLLARRLGEPQVRYISQVADYFSLFLLIGIAITGVLVRHFVKIDLESAKGFALGLLAFSPVLPQVHYLFYVHIFLVSILLAYFPFSKLMHFAGVFLSPTRNLANNSRARRHVNPWNAPVGTHTYAEYEDEFRARMIEAGLPVEKT
jgi:nitrate reductase gamma subunit